jgi:hypothetical protein
MTPEIADALSFLGLIFRGDDAPRVENELMALTPEQEANRENDPSSMKGISDLIEYNRDHLAEPQVSAVFNQTLVEQVLGLEKNSACVLSSIAWLNNTYMQQTGGWGLNTDGVINSLMGQAGKAYSSQGWVLNRNLVGQLVAGSNALVSAGEYTNPTDLQGDGYTYYTEERVHIEDPKKVHTIAHAKGITYDPDIYTSNRWWESAKTSKLKRYVAYKTPF